MNRRAMFVSAPNWLLRIDLLRSFKLILRSRSWSIRMKTKIAALAIFVLSASGVAVAGQNNHGDSNNLRGNFIKSNDAPRSNAVVQSSAVTQAPELDPASLMAGLALLGGGVAVLRGKRANKLSR
jgi:hypothetical protein